MSNNTGGAAFPYAAVHGCNGEYGMTLRDYFAAKAMQATLIDHKLKNFDDYVVSKIAYQMADAMLEAREEHGNE